MNLNNENKGISGIKNDLVSVCWQASGEADHVSQKDCPMAEKVGTISFFLAKEVPYPQVLFPHNGSQRRHVDFTLMTMSFLYQISSGDTQTGLALDLDPTNQFGRSWCTWMAFASLFLHFGSVYQLPIHSRINIYCF